MLSKDNLKYLIFSFVLFVPVFILYGGHFLEYLYNPELLPTGFLGQRDTLYKMALAREYWDADQSGLMYPLPFSDNLNNAPIYFQLHILLLAILLKITPFEPGTILCLFGLFFGILCLYWCIKLFKSLFGLDSLAKKTTLLIFCWGGGALSLMGIAYGLVTYDSFKEVLLNTFQFDPDEGWWGLNFGRNLIYPMETYYHALVTGIILGVLKKNYKLILILVGILALSHPMTGVTFLLIVLAWAFLERYYFSNSNVPNYLIVGTGFIFVFTLAYNFIYLGMDPEHAEIVETHWLVDGFTYQAITFIPAYLFLGIFAIAEFITPQKLMTKFKIPFNRFLFWMFLIVFLLANHEFAFQPHQPLHFEKGYVWFALFLLVAPSCIRLFEFIFNRKKIVRYSLAFAVVFILLFDNITWFIYYTNENFRGGGLAMTKQQKEVLSALNKEVYKDYLLVGEENLICYWASAYTPLRALVAHVPTTPDVYTKEAQVKRLFENGDLDKSLQSRKLIFIDRLDLNQSVDISNILPTTPIVETEKYRVLKYQPTK